MHLLSSYIALVLLHPSEPSTGDVFRDVGFEHLPALITVKSYTPAQGQNKKLRRNFRKANWTTSSETLDRALNNEIQQCDDQRTENLIKHTQTASQVGHGQRRYEDYGPMALHLEYVDLFKRKPALLNASSHSQRVFQRGHQEAS
ncbi:hypothetical protein PoB_005198700 [Plakobranchus ocellatus]|uniref:Uncharacterized protein n=1 Tax=Plakobranchus ocellatus TaxID=259542 RepID=A0AAV4C1J7_9GAST|nr:hypothetical protein PoB_005198700 [Plakobranchus ocellatus]